MFVQKCYFIDKMKMAFFSVTILFIIMEVFFFISFFWTFFHSSLAPTQEIGSIWLPIGITTFDPLNIPLLNTTILLSSGMTVTWAHHAMTKGMFTQVTQMTVVLGIYFTILQGYEYYESKFMITDSVYGSTFYMATGYHGLHVIIGTTLLATCLMRHMKHHFSKSHHVGMEMAIWYWHFVDVVWLFLYISIY